MPCNSACDSCDGPGGDQCTTCPMSCPQVTLPLPLPYPYPNPNPYPYPYPYPYPGPGPAHDPDPDLDPDPDPNLLQAPTDGKCANGQYSLGEDCLPCDASCITGTVGPAGMPQGDSCTGPDASQCTKCPYLCDPSCDAESSPSYADWSGGAVPCNPNLTLTLTPNP